MLGIEFATPVGKAASEAIKRVAADGNAECTVRAHVQAAIARSLCPGLLPVPIPVPLQGARGMALGARRMAQRDAQHMGLHGHRLREAARTALCSRYVARRVRSACASRLGEILGRYRGDARRVRGACASRVLCVCRQRTHARDPHT